jgi:hypothetical protein
MTIRKFNWISDDRVILATAFTGHTEKILLYHAVLSVFWFVYVKNYFQCFPAKRGKNIFKIALVTENVTLSNPGL